MGRHSNDHLFNGLALKVTQDGASVVVTVDMSLSEVHTIESTDPAIIAFLADVVRAMRESGRL